MNENRSSKNISENENVKNMSEIENVKNMSENENVKNISKNENGKKKISKNVKEWILFLSLAIVVALVISFFVRPTIVKQSSMEPTFQNGDYLFVSKQSYGLFGQKPERGDVIVFKSHIESDDGSDKLLIKRVIGIEGDKIEIKDGDVYRNGEKLNEDYIKDPGKTVSNGEDSSNAKYLVPSNSIFVMGDNRKVSVDSRSVAVGYVPINDIYGKVVFRAFPFNKISTF